MIKLVVFDAYGVIIDGGFPPTIHALAEKFNRDYQELYSIFYTKYFNMAAEKKITQQEAWEYAIRDTGLDISVEEVKKIHYGLMSLFPKLVSFADELKDKVTTILLTKNTPEMLSDTENKFSLRPHFYELINTWEINLAKASKETMQYLFKRYNVKPEEVIYFDDQKQNLVAAKELGVNTIHFRYYEQFKLEFDKLFEEQND